MDQSGDQQVFLPRVKNGDLFFCYYFQNFYYRKFQIGTKGETSVRTPTPCAYHPALASSIWTGTDRQKICQRCSPDFPMPHLAQSWSIIWGFPWWLRWWRIHLQCRRPRLNPSVREVPWRREWLPTSIFLSGEFHEQRSLVGYSPWSRRVRHDWAPQQNLL